MTNKAQSTLELVAVITFVTVIIFFIGPTVIRGVNSHFKLWDDSVHDSYSDPMTKADPQTLPTTCVCTGWQGGPGLRCQTSPCLPTERLVSISCNPSNCGTSACVPSGPNERCINNFEKCVIDNTCCGAYQDLNICCAGTTAAAPANCALDQRVTQRICGGAGVQFSARSDVTNLDGNPSCVPQCLGLFTTNPTDPDKSLGVMCPGDDVNLVSVQTGSPPVPPWVQNASGIGFNLTFIGTGIGLCTPSVKCQVYCQAGFMPRGATCVAFQSFQVAPTIANGTNNQSFDFCTTAVVNSAWISGPAPQCNAGNPSGATPGFTCAATAW